MNKKEIFLCSFATENLKQDVKRFLNEALSFNIFKNIFIYGISDLDEKTKKLIRLTSTDKLKSKGYNHGYFVWKPEIIKKTLDKIPENSFLLYTDIGCFLNTKGKKLLKEYIDECNTHSCMGFQYREPDEKLQGDINAKYQKYFEYNYTKMEVFKYFNINKSNNIYNSEVVWAGGFLLKKNKTTNNFVDDWIKASTIQLLKTEYKSKKNPKLIQSSHDQSIFSILFKKYKFKSLCASKETEWILTYDDDNNPKKYWDHLSCKPIQARRRLTKKLSFWTKLINYLYIKLKIFNIKNKKKKLL